MDYQFLIETYQTEIEKVLSVWAMFDDDDLQYTRDWLRSRASTIEGGSSEIQKNIVSKRVLGLPEGKK